MDGWATFGKFVAGAVLLVAVGFGLYGLYQWGASDTARVMEYDARHEKETIQEKHDAELKELDVRAQGFQRVLETCLRDKECRDTLGAVGVRFNDNVEVWGDSVKVLCLRPEHGVSPDEYPPRYKFVGRFEFGTDGQVTKVSNTLVEEEQSGRCSSTS